MKLDAKRRVGWIVDVQNDFMRPDGRLYVKDLADDHDVGAQAIVGQLARVLDWMREHCALVVYTADWHRWDDPEISVDAPDFENTYPPHCMGAVEDPELQTGAHIIDEVRPDEVLVLRRDAAAEEARSIARQAIAQERPVLIQKSRFSVYEGNPVTDAFLDEVKQVLPGSGDTEVVVCGVARDVCVKHAVEGFPARGFRPTILSDATWGLGIEDAADAYARWSRSGRVVILSELIRETPG